MRESANIKHIGKKEQRELVGMREGGRRSERERTEVHAGDLRQQVELIDKDSIFRVDVPT